MMYTIVSDIHLPNRKWKYSAIENLEVGQGFLVPTSDLSADALDPRGTVRSIAWIYSRQLGRKFVTHKDVRGVWVIRKA